MLCRTHNCVVGSANFLLLKLSYRNQLSTGIIMHANVRKLMGYGGMLFVNDTWFKGNFVYKF